MAKSTLRAPVYKKDGTLVRRNVETELPEGVERLPDTVNQIIIKNRN